MNQGTNETLTQPGEASQNINFKAPEDMYLKVKHLAVDRKVTVQFLWVQAMWEFLKRHKEQ